jgi:hypothetical protein
LYVSQNFRPALGFFGSFGFYDYGSARKVEFFPQAVRQMPLG